VVAGKLTGKAGQTLTAGRLGKRTVLKGGIVILSKPLVFTPANIDKYHF
jgi:rhamnose transport system substrate-binding protein